MTRNGRAPAAGLLFVTLLAACGGPPPLPQPRTVIVYTGERLNADPERMAEVDGWLRDQQHEIERDPSFLIRLLREEDAVYPWQTLELVGDTAIISTQRTAADTETPFMSYAHLRLMAERDELERWLPDAAEARGLELEHAILERTADIWFLGRAVYNTQAYGPLDELLYAREGGFLNELILTTQVDRFEEERTRYFAERPEREEEFREWFQRTFERDGPGFVDRADDSEREPARGAPGRF
jgi:hypothetical protein